MQKLKALWSKLSTSNVLPILWGICLLIIITSMLLTCAIFGIKMLVNVIGVIL